jgi:hypothetical protein
MTVLYMMKIFVDDRATLLRFGDNVLCLNPLRLLTLSRGGGKKFAADVSASNSYEEHIDCTVYMISLAAN